MMKQLIAACLLACMLAACQGSSTKVDLAIGDDTEASLKNPFIHSVYFWFKEEVTEAQLAEFYADTEMLREIEVVKALYTGKPAATDRPIVERSYDFAVIVHFEDLAGHDSYQQHATHLSLLEKHANLWEKVMVTDVEN